MVPRDHYVRFYRPVETTDAAGAVSVTFSSAFAMPVSFRIERDTMTTEGDIRPSGRVSAKIMMPYFGALARGWRVIYNNESWDVETVRDPWGDRKELELTVVAVEQ